MQSNQVSSNVAVHAEAANQAVSAQDLVDYLEGVSGKVFYTRQDVSAWLTEMRDRAEQQNKTGTSRKRLLLLVGLLAAFLQYQIIDMMIEMNSLRGSGITSPVRNAAYRS